eukprot:COSAG02_NODE_34207_length_488_cov_0.557841_1_plen_29_part_10
MNSDSDSLERAWALPDVLTNALKFCRPHS